MTSSGIENFNFQTCIVLVKKYINKIIIIHSFQNILISSQEFFVPDAFLTIEGGIYGMCLFWLVRTIKN